MTKSLNIGIVANTAFNIYNFRLGLIKFLQQEGHTVWAIAPADDYIPLIEKNNIPFVEVKHLSRKGTNPIYDLQLCNEFRKIYHSLQLDVVLQYTIKPNIYGTLAARMAGTKAICTVTGLGYTFLNKSVASTIAHQLYKVAFNFAEKVLFQNADDLQIFTENKLVNKKKTMTVPGSGIDTNKFNPTFCTSKKKDNITRFLMIGRLLNDKGINEYIAAAQKILAEQKTAEFHLLGDIDNNNPAAIQKEELEKWITDGIITYHGYTKDTRPYICEADCIVLPSYREGMPRAILEGMAMSKPCITTDAAGCKDSIEDNVSGFLCRTADINSLKEKFELFLALEEKQRIQMGENARKRATTIFSEDAVCLIYKNILLKL